jgi:hypothetical protein
MNIVRFTANQVILADSCTQWNVPNNSPEENSDLSSAIQSVAGSTGIDPRFILAIVMQESNGCVRAPTTNYGVVNPGLMQSHDGSGSCNNGGVQHPCPPTEIVQMIQDGTSGTSSGDGLQQILAGIGGTDVSMYYQAARIYNSGSIATTGGEKNLGAGIATHCYASDVANRLTGWTTAASTCNQNSIADDTGTPVSGGDSSVSPVTVPTTIAAAPSVTIATTAQAPTPTSTTEAGVFAATGTAAATVVTSVSTALVVPTPAATPTSTTPAPAPAAATTPASTPPTTTGSETPGSACSEEGMFNCVGGTSFQQCGSGTWSVVQSLAAGTTCNPGQSMDLVISKPKRMRARSGRLVEARIPIAV